MHRPLSPADQELQLQSLVGLVAAIHGVEAIVAMVLANKNKGVTDAGQLALIGLRAFSFGELLSLMGKGMLDALRDEIKLSSCPVTLICVCDFACHCFIFLQVP